MHSPCSILDKNLKNEQFLTYGQRFQRPVGCADPQKRPKTLHPDFYSLYYAMRPRAPRTGSRSVPLAIGAVQVQS